MQLSTKRLIMIPLSLKQLEERKRSFTDVEMRDFYDIKLTECLKNKKQYQWHTIWMIKIASTGEEIGEFCFLGEPDEKRTVEFNFHIKESQRNNGYGTELLINMYRWAFTKANAYYIRCRVSKSNLAASRVLDKCKFQHLESDEEEDIWELERPKSSWIPIYMCLGVTISMMIGYGMEYDHILIGIGKTLSFKLDFEVFCVVLGMLVGVLLGMIFDRVDNENRVRK